MAAPAVEEAKAKIVKILGITLGVAALLGSVLPQFNQPGVPTVVATLGTLAVGVASVLVVMDVI